VLRITLPATALPAVPDPGDHCGPRDSNSGQATSLPPLARGRNKASPAGL